MKIIERNYLETLKKVMGTPDIKIITGVRRSGKSVLLKCFKEYAAQEIKDVNIIHVDYNKLRFEDLQEYHRLHDYVEEHYLEGQKNLLLIDEVQLCSGFETAINSLHASMKYDIYITGSNAFLMSNDLATLFTGRAFPVEVFPFSFREFLKYYGDDQDRYEMLDRYLQEGGFAGSYIYDDLPEKYRYIAEIYNTMIIRDIEQKHNIQNIPVLQKVGDYLLNNIGNLITGRNITNVLNSDKQDTNNKTIGTYLNYLCEAFAFYKVKRYDINGKMYLHSQDKYYLCDHTLKYAKLGQKNIDLGSAYENIVAIELLRRGYEVYVGMLRGKEIDFVALKQDEKIYIQVSYDIAEKSTFECEVAPLLDVRDAYPKLLIARTRQPERQYEGIRILDLADWLAEQ